MSISFQNTPVWNTTKLSLFVGFVRGGGQLISPAESEVLTGICSTITVNGVRQLVHQNPPNDAIPIQPGSVAHIDSAGNNLTLRFSAPGGTETVVVFE